MLKLIKKRREAKRKTAKDKGLKQSLYEKHSECQAEKENVGKDEPDTTDYTEFTIRGEKRVGKKSVTTRKDSDKE